MAEIISLENLLANGAIVNEIARATNLRASDVKAVLARLAHLPCEQSWGLCEAARIDEEKQRERMRRKGRR